MFNWSRSTTPKVENKKTDDTTNITTNNNNNTVITPKDLNDDELKQLNQILKSEDELKQSLNSSKSLSLGGSSQLSQSQILIQSQSQQQLSQINSSSTPIIEIHPKVKNAIIKKEHEQEHEKLQEQNDKEQLKEEQQQQLQLQHKDDKKDDKKEKEEQNSQYSKGGISSTTTEIEIKKPLRKQIPIYDIIPNITKKRFNYNIIEKIEYDELWHYCNIDLFDFLSENNRDNSFCIMKMNEISIECRILNCENFNSCNIYYLASPIKELDLKYYIKNIVSSKKIDLTLDYENNVGIINYPNPLINSCKIEKLENDNENKKIILDVDYFQLNNINMNSSKFEELVGENISLSLGMLLFNSKKYDTYPLKIQLNYEINAEIQYY